MRQAADILSSAPAMQIRYLEAMQAMAKSANSKVIFLPAANQTVGPNALTAAMSNTQNGEASNFAEFGDNDPSFSHAMNARVVENI